MTATPDAESIRRVLKNNTGAVEVFDLAVALGVEVPVSRERLMDQIAWPRNLAVHQGETPEPITVRRAQETATKILEVTSPL
jgi:hypothetical protein